MDVVEISREDWDSLQTELTRLRTLEADLPGILERAKTEWNAEKLALLHQSDKQNPDAVRKRFKRHYDTHKDAINARRREKRAKAKAAAGLQAALNVDVIEN